MITKQSQRFCFVRQWIKLKLRLQKKQVFKNQKRSKTFNPLYNLCNLYSSEKERFGGLSGFMSDFAQFLLQNEQFEWFFSVLPARFQRNSSSNSTQSLSGFLTKALKTAHRRYYLGKIAHFLKKKK